MEKYSNYWQCDLKDKTKQPLIWLFCFFYLNILIICLGKIVVKN